MVKSAAGGKNKGKGQAPKRIASVPPLSNGAVTAVGADPTVVTSKFYDAELGRLQGARRILLKGGLVLSLDRQVGDFARADVLIEDGKIREVRPDIAVSGDATAVSSSH